MRGHRGFSSCTDHVEHLSVWGAAEVGTFSFGETLLLWQLGLGRVVTGNPL